LPRDELRIHKRRLRRHRDHLERVALGVIVPYTGCAAARPHLDRLHVRDLACCGLETRDQLTLLHHRRHVVVVKPHEGAQRRIHRGADAQHGDKERSAEHEHDQRLDQAALVAQHVADRQKHGPFDAADPLQPGQQTLRQAATGCAAAHPGIVQRLVGRHACAADHRREPCCERQE